MAYNSLRSSGLMPDAKQDSRIVALYTRVSTGYQIDKDSLPQQKKELTSYCEHVLHIPSENLEVFEDAGKSGKNTDRPAFQRMMNKVRAGLISHVVVCKIDRISRNLVDFSIMYDVLKYNRVAFISLNEQFDTSTAMGETMLKIILVFAELERKLTSERVTDIMIGRAMDGKWNGARMPYGWKWDEKKKFPVHHPTEADNVRLMYQMYEQTKSTVKVFQYFNTNNIPTKRGGLWTTKTIADTIRNPMNKGDYRYNYRESARGRKKPDEEVIYREGIFEPIVDPEQWNRCVAIMDYNTAAKHSIGFSPNKKNTHVFSGLLRCACGASFHVSKLDRARENGFRPTLYVCGCKAKKGTCKAPNISDVYLGPFIFNYIRNLTCAMDRKNEFSDTEQLEQILLRGPEFKNLIGLDKECLSDTLHMLQFGQASYSETKLSSAEVNDTTLTKLQTERSKIERAIERLKNLFLFTDDSISEKEFLSTKQELTGKLISLDNQIAELKDASLLSSTDELSFVQAASSFLLLHDIKNSDHIVYKDFAATISPETLKDFVRSIIDVIFIQNKKIVSIRFKNGLEHRFIYKE